MVVQSQVCDEVSAWLSGEFSGRLPAGTVAAVVRATHDDLDGRIVPDDHGELLYRVARARLQRVVAAPPSPRTRR
ncbi:hypothetical protein [Amycolatopsis jejuensis]|uniref:hypothetical protein n=1 Tax=Amycolatopsis jejuensis TaxID=330084 RepID=UPI000A0205EE|nr:hypothetical protein [Amycolatopsis jejuensis]